MNRFPWTAEPERYAYRGRCAIYSCRDAAEIDLHLAELTRRALSLPGDHPHLQMLCEDIKALLGRGMLLADLEAWTARRGACSCMDPTCGLLAEEAS